ncbi:MAG: HgcAB-like fusion protein, partial [Alphaproteobacteria bacterium]
MGTFFRWFPHRAPTGLTAVGHPNETSPVLVTGNYTLTVSRLIRALRGQNLWLLATSSGGINVWCAACGGEFTEHQVISAIKTSMLAEKVRHREVILPLLAAPGMDLRQIYEKAGFHAKFGPVSANDIPAYLAAGMKKENRMNRISLGLKHRMDMLLSMNFVIWLLPAVLFAIFWPQHLLHLSLLFWIAAFLLYAGFPWIPGKTGWTKALMLVAVLWAGYMLVGGFQRGDWLAFWPWMAGGAALTLAVGFDLAGIVEAVPSDAESLVQRMGISR